MFNFYHLIILFPPQQTINIYFDTWCKCHRPIFEEQIRFLTALEVHSCWIFFVIHCFHVSSTLAHQIWRDEIYWRWWRWNVRLSIEHFFVRTHREHSFQPPHWFVMSNILRIAWRSEMKLNGELWQWVKIVKNGRKKMKSRSADGNNNSESWLRMGLAKMFLLLRQFIKCLFKSPRSVDSGWAIYASFMFYGIDDIWRQKSGERCVQDDQEWE